MFSVGSAAGIAMSSYAPSPSMASSRDTTKRVYPLKVRVSGFEVVLLSAEGFRSKVGFAFGNWIVGLRV